MNWKSTAVVSGATLLATWFGWTTTPTHERAAAAAPPRDTRPVGAVDIQQQADRLQIRMRAEADYRDPSRNPFRFGRTTAPVRVQRPEPPVAVAAQTVVPPPPALTLSGIATDTVDGKVLRTAIITAPSGLLLVKEGDRVADYTVTRVEDAAVELAAPDGATRTLTLTP